MLTTDSMNRTFVANVEALRDTHPLLCDRLQQASLPQDRRCTVNERDIPVYEALHGERWLQLTSAYHPQREAELQADTVDDLAADYIVVVGEAGFYHLESVLSQANEDARVVLLSQSLSTLRLILSSRDLTATLSDRRLCILVQSSYGHLQNELIILVTSDSFRVPTFAVMIHPVEQRLDPSFAESCLGMVHTVFQTALVNFHTTAKFDEWWAENFVANCLHMMTSSTVDLVRDGWEKRPVIIVGAGPSLTKQLERLREAKGKALILCVDTAYRTLYNHGIVPDAIVSIDGNPLNASHLADVPIDGIPLVMDTYVHKDIPRHHTGPKLLLTSSPIHWPWWAQIRGRDEPFHAFDTGGSVATAAFNLARVLGADPVIFIGEDLAYTGEVCYADGALFSHVSVEDMAKGQRIETVTDIDGQPVRTTYAFKFYLRWLEERALQGGRRYINATEGGALQHGFELRTFKDVLDECCRDPQPIDQWHRLVAGSATSSEDRESAMANIRKSRRELRAVRRWFVVLARMLEQYSVAVKTDRTLEAQAIALKMDLIREKIHGLTLATAFLDGFAFSPIVQDIHFSRAKLDLSEMDRGEGPPEETVQALLTVQRATLFAQNMAKRSEMAASIMNDALGTLGYQSADDSPELQMEVYV